MAHSKHKQINYSTLPGSLGAKTLYYQCKTCSSFLSSSSKWATHLQSCRSTGSAEGSSIPRPVGLRLVTFMEPKLILERVNYKLTDDVKTDCKKTDNSEFCEYEKNLKIYKTSGQDSGSAHGKSLPSKPVHKKLGKVPATGTGCIIAQNLQQPNLELKKGGIKLGSRARKGNRKLVFNAKKNAEGRIVSNRQQTKLHRKSSNLKAKVKLQDMLTTNSIDDTVGNQLADNVTVTNDDTIIKTAKQGKSLILEDGSEKYFWPAGPVEKEPKSLVRAFRFRCNLCPGGFYTKFEFDRHVNGVHCGTRKLMYCCVCDRVFNRRDSLNDHILVHEKAEAYDEKYKFLQQWTEETRKGLTGVSHAFAYCKFCLLSHSTYHSYITHIREEHTSTPETFEFHCKFENCPKKFRSIKTMVEHAKLTHPKMYYGRLSLMRMKKGIFTGEQVCPRDVFGNYIKKEDSAHSATQKKKVPVKQVRKRTKRSQLSKPVKSFTPFQKPLSDLENSDDDEVPDPEDDDWARKHRSSIRHIPKTLHQPSPQVKNIELESIQIDGGTHDYVQPVIKRNSTCNIKMEQMNLVPDEMILNDTNVAAWSSTDSVLEVKEALHESQTCAATTTTSTVTQYVHNLKEEQLSPTKIMSAGGVESTEDLEGENEFLAVEGSPTTYTIKEEFY
ncbi:unnamed protein product [Orchesella dallaii]|uniref:C2H2-type domain-containing protein n=1 Tax=Orchesella dallaii TaxID=48710 RepID=A0ABP1RDS5_9HEXA